MKVKLDIENRTIIRLALLTVGLWLAVQVVIQIQSALVLLLVSFFLALALNGPVSYLATKIPGGSRGLATGIAYLAVLGVLGAFLYSTVPPLVNETIKLVDTVPERIEEFREGSQGGFIADFIDKYDLQDEADDLVSNITSNLGDISGNVVSGVGTVAGGLINVLTVLVLTFFMLVEGPTWMKLFWSYTPEERLDHNKQMAQRMYNVVTGYVNGQLLIALLAGISSFIAMLLVGAFVDELPNPIALAGVITMTGLIPLIGATLGAVIVVIVALFQSFTAAIIMAIFFLAYQQIENNAIQPYVQSRTLDMSPLLVLGAVIVGFHLGGMLGGFLAIPAAGVMRILILDFFEQQKSKREKKKPRLGKSKA